VGEVLCGLRLCTKKAAMLQMEQRLMYHKLA
jgi:hypothetical protein